MATRAEPIAAAPSSARTVSGAWLRRRPLVLAVAGVAALLLALVAGVAAGPVAIAPGNTVAILTHALLGWPTQATWPQADQTIVLDLRLPRVLMAMAVGAGLAVAGATFQGILRNPLADPYVLGTASGAALGAAVAVVIPLRALVFGLGLVQALAFLGALGAVFVVYRLSRIGQLGSMTGLLLTGYAVGSLLAAGLAVTMYLSGDDLRQIFFFLLGGFSDASWSQLAGAAPLIILGSLAIMLRARTLNGLLLGEEAAAHLGLDVARERAVLLVLASLVTGAAVAVAGLIGFVGLIVPHVVRLGVGANARLLLPFSALFGASFLAFSDLLARLPGEVPVGIVTALIGAPFFLYLLSRARGGYEL